MKKFFLLPYYWQAYHSAWIHLLSSEYAFGKLDVKNHGELNCKNGYNIFVKLGGLCNFEANPTINL